MTTTSKTIWRTSPTPTTYTPRWVDSKRRVDGEVYYENGTEYVAVVDSSNGYWEIPTQWFYNAGHENRKDVSYTDLVAHFSSIAKNQSVPPEMFSNEQNATRLQYDIDYGVGGTIKEHNDSFDLLSSAVFATANNPLKVLEFAKDQYAACINNVKRLIVVNVKDALLNTNQFYVTDFTNSFSEQILTAYQQNDFYNSIYGDSQTADYVPNWIQTIPFMGGSDAYSPSYLVDEDRGISQLRHHDNHLSTVYVDTTTTTRLKNQIINTVVVGSPERLRGWTPSQPADGDDSIQIDNFVDIPYTRLLANDFWLGNDGSFYKFAAVIQPTQPSLELAENSYWLRSSDGQLFYRTDSVPSGWDVAAAVEDHSDAWEEVNFTHILGNTLLAFEELLYQGSKNVQQKWTDVDYILDNDDEELFLELEEQSFLTYVKELSINAPYSSDYSVSDPFTWNYSSVDFFSVWQPYVFSSTLWAARYTTIYENIFNTPYPHLEPWRLQGYKYKPAWWNQYYQGTTRRWSTLMWDNIKAGLLPHISCENPEGVITLPTYSFVCVNTTSSTTSDGYGPDALLPPYWIAPTNSVTDSAVALEVFIRSRSVILSTNMNGAYEFGEEGLNEWNWRQSNSYLYDVLINSFKLQPVRFMHTLWGLDYVYKDSLNVDTYSQRVSSHERTIFHGDVIDGDIYIAPGINQWYINYNRFLNNDIKTSDFRTLWNDWRMQYSYQIGNMIDPQSLDVRTSRFIVDDNDRSLVIKRSQNVDEKQIDALKVSITGYGTYKTRKKNRIPRGSGHDWTFMIDNLSSLSRTVNYYGVKDYVFTINDFLDGIFETEDPFVYVTGDVIQLNSTDALPLPLRNDQEYYLIKVSNTTFKIADSYDDAVNNISIVLEDVGVGQFKLHTALTSFYAYGGVNTATTWFHNEINKNQINEVTFPVEIVGIQNVINFIDGYAAYVDSQGFKFNQYEVTDIDPTLGVPFTWQTETERFIDKVYTGLGTDNNISPYETKIYDFVVDTGLNQIILTNKAISFDDGAEVFFYSSSVTPQGLVPNKAYYLIVIDASLGRYKVASTYTNALDYIPITISSSGVGTLFMTTYISSAPLLEDYVEINPFRNNIWLNTNNGIISHVVKGPYDETSAALTVYDQYGRTIDNNNVQVYRQDRQTRIHVYSNIKNDMLPEYKQTAYNNIHIAGWKAYIDYIEHVVVFNNTLSDNTLVYDPFLGLGVAKFDVVYDVNAADTNRSSMGGFVINGNNLVRNIEGMTEDLRNAYSTYDSRESAAMTEHARNLMGYVEPAYLEDIVVDDKSKFVFWKGVIQQKGSNNSIDAFVNASSFINAEINEYWAYKVMTFGSNTQPLYPLMKVNTSDLTKSDLRLDFNITALTQEPFYKSVNYNDNATWANLPEIKRLVPSTFQTFKVDGDLITQTEIVQTGSYVELDNYCDAVIITDSERVYQEGTDYTILTNKLIKVGTITAEIGSANPVSIDYDTTSPIITSMTVPRNNSTNLMVFVDGILVSPDIDYTNDTNTSITHSDTYGTASIQDVFVIENVDVARKQVNGDSISPYLIDMSDMPYDSDKHNLFVFVDGRLHEPNLDYIEQTPTVLKWLYALPSVNIIDLFVVDATITRASISGSSVVDGVITFPLEYRLGNNDFMLFCNGTLYVNGRDYVETTTSSVTLSVPYTSGDQFTVIAYLDYQINPSRAINIHNIIPSKTKHSPIQLIDIVGKKSICSPFLWDPARDYHNHTAMKQIDVVGGADPTYMLSESTVPAGGGDISFVQYKTFGSDKDVNGYMNVVPYNVGDNDLFVFVNGVKVKADVDYEETDSVTIRWLNELTSDDEIFTFVLQGNTVVYAEFLGSDLEVSGSPVTYSLTTPFKFVPNTNSVLVFVNGRMLEPGVDYVEFNTNTILWNNVLSETDDIELYFVSTVFIRTVKHGSDLVLQESGKYLLELPNEYVMDVDSLIVFVNGSIIPFTENTKTSILIDEDYEDSDDIVILYNSLLELTDSEDTEWDDTQVGKVWWDTTNLGYVFYHDPRFVNGTDNQLANWGKLANWASVDLRQWTKSSVPPSEYDALAVVEEGDSTIDENKRAAGTAVKFVKFNGEFINTSKLSLNCYKAVTPDITTLFSNVQKDMFVSGVDIAVYVNQTQCIWMKYDSFDMNKFADKDFLHITKYIHTVKYPRIVIDVGGSKVDADETGLDTRVYAFTINYNNTEYFISVVNATTYSTLIEKINNELPDDLHASFNDEGNIQIELRYAVKDNHSLEIITDNLFKNLTGFVSTSDMLNFEETETYATGFSEDYRYITIPRVNSQGVDFNDYYFWVKDKSIAQNKDISLKDITRLITTPTTPHFLIKKFLSNESVTLGASDNSQTNLTRYTQMVVRNMKDFITSDNRYGLVLTSNDSLRDYKSYERNNTRQPMFEEWKLFKNGSKTKVDTTLWKKLTDSVVGYDTDNMTTIVPNSDRVTFDLINNTNTRYGLGIGQTFGDVDNLLTTITSYLLSDNVINIPLNIVDFIDSFDFEVIDERQEFMNQLYYQFDVATVNGVFFECLMDMLALQSEEQNLIKTSFVSVRCATTFDIDGEK